MILGRPAGFWMTRFKLVGVFACAVLSVVRVQGQTTPFSGMSLPTTVRAQGSGWWPTKGEASREEYAGEAECRSCHGSKAASYGETAMSRASVHASDLNILRQHQRLAFRQGPLDYSLTTTADHSTLQVGNQTTSLSEELLWGFGAGRMGQTYIYSQENNFFESRLSFFSEIAGLDITPGHSRMAPDTLPGALGVKQDPPSEIHRCFACHTTASMNKGEFDPAHALPGLTCEACHGPGAQHVRAMKSGIGSTADSGANPTADPTADPTKDPTKDLILNPARLDPVDQVDFCGACHRTWQDVVGSGLTGVGVLNVRFAPYRLENSKCWKQQDARLTCVACHDPHKPLVRDAGSYDSRCLQCHVLRRPAKKLAKGAPGACPVATKDCVTCHMPKYEPANLHSSFTDHWIRIVRPGQPYPN